MSAPASDVAAGSLLPVLVPGQAARDAAAAAAAGPGFWGRVGQGFASAGRAVAGSAQAAFGAVDPDMRADLAKMPLMALTTIGRRHAPVTARSGGRGRPVVFVHGLGGHRGNFTPMRFWFHAHGRRRTYGAGLPSGVNLEAMAGSLRTFLRDVAEVNGLPDERSVDIVGHSMGGVVARLALQDPGMAALTANLVTLGSPHHGTQAARFAGADLVVQLRPGSPPLRRLEEELPWRGPTRLVCFWSRADPLMQPAETARVDGADNREVPGFRHLDWVLRRDAWSTVFHALEDEQAG